MPALSVQLVGECVMTRVSCSSTRPSQRKPIAACIASLFALSAPATTLAALVSNCLDDGSPGTLRSAIAATAEGGTVTFTGLICSTITLAGSGVPSGEIYIGQNSLTIDGTTAPSQVTVDAVSLPRGYYDSRVFKHTGTGTLTVKDLVLTNGYILHSALQSYGGCLSSAGIVVLSNQTTVTKCSTNQVGGYAPRGGAVYVAGNLTLNNSTVSYGTATGITSALGGGVFVKGNL